MAGRARGTRVADFDKFDLVGSYTDAQSKILAFLRAAGFGELQILRPSREFDAPDPMAVMLERTDDRGAMVYDPRLMQAFVALNKVWKGGLVIGEEQPYLQLDSKSDNYARAIGIRSGLLTNRDKAYENSLQRLKASGYRYTGDGGVDWNRFWQEAEKLPEDKKNFLELIVEAEKELRGIGQIALGFAALYFGWKALQYIKPFSDLAKKVTKKRRRAR